MYPCDPRGNQFAQRDAESNVGRLTFVAQSLQSPHQAVYYTHAHNEDFNPSLLFKSVHAKC